MKNPKLLEMIEHLQETGKTIVTIQTFVELTELNQGFFRDRLSDRSVHLHISHSFAKDLADMNISLADMGLGDKDKTDILVFLIHAYRVIVMRLVLIRI